MNKGIVMEMNGNELIVMTREGSFERVPKGSRSCQVGEEIVFSAPMKKLRKIPFSMPSSFAAAAVVCLIVIGGLSGIGRHPVIAYVSMDINPSVEMGIDSSDHVRELRGLNSDGTQLIDQFVYKGKTLDEVTGALIDKASDKGYFSQGITTDIVIASTVVKPAAVEPKGETTIADEVKSRVAEQLSSKHEAEANTVEVTAIATPVEVREQAQHNGLSAGKYAIYLAASNNGLDIPLQAYKEDSIRDIASKNGGLDNMIKSGKPSTADEWKKLVKDDKDGALSEKAKKLAESSGRGNGNGKDNGNGPGKDNNGKANNSKNDDNGNSNNGKSGNGTINGNHNGNNNGKNSNGNNNGKSSNNGKGTTSPGNVGKGTHEGNGNTGSAGNDNGRGTTDNGKGNNNNNQNNGKNDDKNDGKIDGKLPPVKLPAVTGPNRGQSGVNPNSSDKQQQSDNKKNADEVKKQDNGKQGDSKGNSNDASKDKSKIGDKQAPSNNGKQADDGKDKPPDNKKPNSSTDKSDEAKKQVDNKQSDNKQADAKQSDKKQEDKKQSDKKSTDDSKQQDKDKKSGNDNVGRAENDSNVFSEAFFRFEELFNHRRSG